MDSARWRRLQPILNEVLDLSGEERRERLDRVCAGDPDLRAEIEALLDADAETAGALDRPLFQDVLDALLPGTRIADRYRIVSLLGRGGMGEVYRADDLKLGQAVALKFLPVHLQQQPGYLERLIEETKLARQVAHPNVCRVYDLGEWQGRHFLTMEYIDGEDLASLITRIGHLSRQKALDIARQLCAGLDAAHQLGILHRDLKPANVMLDGRGRVRITDFGLAVTTTRLEGIAIDIDARAGTPAYMAPEQFEGRSATGLSDIYALGLVLYELFTGRRAYPAAPIDELRRLHDESSPTRPSMLVDDLDPLVERAILRCLERDPALRPPTVREVSALLPGGDPIAAALAAGETPSPDLVAASGPDGSLRPAVAFGVLGATIAMLTVLVVLVDRASILGWVDWPRNVGALEDNSRAILQRLGHDLERVDYTQRIHVGWYWPWIQYVAARDASPDRWRPLREPGSWPIVYDYRQSARVLVPLGSSEDITPRNPPLGDGDALVTTDRRGQLRYLEVPTPEAAPPQAVASDPDWFALFREAGLDPRRFEPVAPTRNPRIAADARAAWSGVLPDFGSYPIRVEAAAYRGKAVFFELVVPWDSYWEPDASPPRRSPQVLGRLGFLIAILIAITTTGLLAIRNWLSGRGDRPGAFRVAFAVLVLRFLVWVLGGHHVPVPEVEWWMLLAALGRALTDAAFTWAFYVALEPYGRRLHPRLLVSWTRVLRGRLRDPLVGRDVLYGVAASTLVILFWAELFVIVPHAIGASSPPPPLAHAIGGVPFLSVLGGGGPLQVLLGGRHVLEAVPAVVVRAFGIAFLFFMLFLGLRFVLRKRWAAAIAMLAIGTALIWPSGMSGYQPIGLACSAAGALVTLMTLRAGLVGVLTLYFCLGVWLNFPVTANSDAPHFGTGIVGILIIGALAAYGAFTSARASSASVLRPDLAGQRATT
jgi:serine/threonine-protein kinase